MKVNSRIATLVFRRVDLVFFMEILRRLPWEVAVKNKVLCSAGAELVDLQGPPLQGTRMVHPDVQDGKQAWQKASTDEEGTLD